MIFYGIDCSSLKIDKSRINYSKKQIIEAVKTNKLIYEIQRKQ